jgi:hypothetical protein
LQEFTRQIHYFVHAEKKSKSSLLLHMPLKSDVSFAVLAGQLSLLSLILPMILFSGTFASVLGTEDGFPEIEQQVDYEFGPDPPVIQKTCDPPDWQDQD